MRALILAFALFLGWLVPLHAGPPMIETVDQAQGPEGASVLVAQVHFVTCLAHDSSSGATRSAWFNQYAYAGGDPVNRGDPSGLDWVDYRSDGSFVLLSINNKRGCSRCRIKLA